MFALLTTNTTFYKKTHQKYYKYISEIIYFSLFFLNKATSECYNSMRWPRKFFAFMILRMMSKKTTTTTNKQNVSKF
jgi:hypothetical protein